MSHEIDVSGVYKLLDELKALKKESQNKDLVAHCQTNISTWVQFDIERELYIKQDDTIISYIERLQNIISYIILNSEKRKQRIDFVVSKISELCVMNTMFQNINVFDEPTSLYYYVWPAMYSHSSPLQKAKDVYIKLENYKNQIIVPQGESSLLNKKQISSIIAYLESAFQFSSVILNDTKLTICLINAQFKDMDSAIIKNNQNGYIIYSTNNTDSGSSDIEVFVHELAHLLIDKITGNMEEITILKPFFENFYTEDAPNDMLAELIPNLMCAGFLVDSEFDEYLPYEMSQDDARYLKKVNQALIELYKTFQEPSLIKRKISDIFEDNSCEP